MPKRANLSTYHCRVVGGLSLIVLTVAGCGPRTGTVSGKVTYQGQPLPSGRITFVCEGGTKPVSTRDIANGAYTVPDLPPGNARVAIATFQVKQDAVPGAIQSPVPTDVPGAAAGPFVAIPDRYRMPDTSGLTLTITGGAQTKDWELTP